MVTITIVVLAARELDFTAAVRRPFHFVRDTLAREAFAVDTALLIAVALAAESQNTGGVGLIAATAALFHPSLHASRGWRLMAAAVLGATLVLPLVDVVEKRVVSTLVRERHGTTDHGFATFLPGMRVPTATLAGSRLMTRLQSEWLPYLDELDGKGFDLDGDPASTSPATRAAWAISVAEAGANFQRLGYASKAQRYTTIDFAESFPRLLGLTPARGTTLAMDFGRTVPAYSVAQASAYLADADGVFFRTCILPGANTNPATFRIVLERRIYPTQAASLLGFLQPYPLKGPRMTTLPRPLVPEISDLREAPQPRPLILDLDGTLVRADMLLETVLALLRTAPWRLFDVGVWMLRGRAYLKRRLAEETDIEPDVLPFNEELLAYAADIAASGRPVYVATAADAKVAEKVVRRIPFIRGVIGSDGVRNLKGEAKALVLAERFPDGFDYAGDARADIPIWRRRRERHRRRSAGFGAARRRKRHDRRQDLPATVADPRAAAQHAPAPMGEKRAGVRAADSRRTGFPRGRRVRDDMRFRRPGSGGLVHLSRQRYLGPDR